MIIFSLVNTLIIHKERRFNMASYKKTKAVYVMTDEEFDKANTDDGKEPLLEELDTIKKSSRKKFSLKDIGPSMEKPKKPEPEDNTLRFSSDISDLGYNIDANSSRGFTISDELWNDMVDRFDEISPIDDISYEDKTYYRRHSSEEDKFDEMFKKERSMLSEVLSDVQKRSKLINNKITSMSSSKGAYGVTKNYVDLVSASASLDTNKLQIIKALVDVKKTIVDLRLKEQKVNPETEVEDNDTVADRFYKNIIRGGAKDFARSSMEEYQVPVSDQTNDTRPFNLSQPISDQVDDNFNPDEVDQFGYIRNEGRNVSVCIHRFSDGSLSFVALDDDGEIVDDYELPSNTLLDTIDIKPMSEYAYDKYNRRYKIIDVETNGVSLDDLDDESYDNVSDDDKYDY